MGLTCCTSAKQTGQEILSDIAAMEDFPGLATTRPLHSQEFDNDDLIRGHSSNDDFIRQHSSNSVTSTGDLQTPSVFMQELYPGLAAEMVHGHRPQVMFCGHVKPGNTSEQVVDYLLSRGYRALLNIQESSEPEFMDLEDASTTGGLTYLHIPVPAFEDAEDGQMHEDRLTLELARLLGIVLMVLPRPVMIKSNKSAKRAAAVWFFDHVVKRNLSSAQVMMITASAGLGFAKNPPLLYWVGRFMMMVDTERALNREVFGDLKFKKANELEDWDPNDTGFVKQVSGSTSASNRTKETLSPRLPKKQRELEVKVTGPDGTLQNPADTVIGWNLPSHCPFTKIVFPGFSDATMTSSTPQTTFGMFRMAGFAKHSGARWLVERHYRSILNLGHSEDVDFIDLGQGAREQGVEYMHIPVEDPDLKTDDYSLNLARILALTILGMPRPLMIVSGSMKRASAAWTFAYATRWDIGSAEIENMTRSVELNFTLSPKLDTWVKEFMKLADAAIARGDRVLGPVEFTGQKLPRWHLDLSAKTSSR